ncbi:MAG: DNA-binding protein [Cyanobacteriota bacterium]|nr:DNA-binding protein [Cyanobacteriota bacterium]
MIGTTEAAKLLEISARRLRCLLAEDRVIGAFKAGRNWVIPVIEGLPKIKAAARGPKSIWKKLQTPAKSVIHINRQVVGKKVDDEYIPPISVKYRKENIYCLKVEIPGPCTLVYQPESPLPGCKATAWIESFIQPIVKHGCNFEEVKQQLKKLNLEPECVMI